MPRYPEKIQQVFVAYSYNLYAASEYRRVFERVGQRETVKFVFADTRITSKHILDKITEMIRDSSFSLFDISDWNPNVTLELGIARGMGQSCYLLINPSKTRSSVHDAPADLRGIDRVQYGSFEELEQGLTRLIGQRTPETTGSPRSSNTSEVVFCNEMFEVMAKRHIEVHAQLAKGTRLAVFARETSGESFDLYVMDRKNYVKFCEDRSEVDWVAITDRSVVSLDKRVPREAVWHVVVDAYGKVNDREVALDVRARLPTGP